MEMIPLGTTPLTSQPASDPASTEKLSKELADFQYHIEIYEAIYVGD